MTNATWTQERVDQLQAHINAGLSCSQIADEIGVTRNAVIGKIHRLGIGPGRPAARPTRQSDPGAPPHHLSQRRLLRAVYGQASRVAETPEDPPALVESPHPCSLFELTQNRCRWPINDPGNVDFGFCGNDSIAGFSYCTGHTRMAYRLPPRRHVYARI